MSKMDKQYFFDTKKTEKGTVDLLMDLVKGHNDNDKRIEANKEYDEQAHRVIVTAMQKIEDIADKNAERIDALEIMQAMFDQNMKCFDKVMDSGSTDIKPEHQHRTENLIADPEDLTTESWPVDDGVRPLPTGGHWECSECGKDWGHGETLLSFNMSDDAWGNRTIRCYGYDGTGCEKVAVKWIEPKADLSDYSEEAQESVLRGLKQKGDIDRGSFAEFANTENKADTVTAEPDYMSPEDAEDLIHGIEPEITEIVLSNGVSMDHEDLGFEELIKARAKIKSLEYFDGENQRIYVETLGHYGPNYDAVRRHIKKLEAENASLRIGCLADGWIAYPKEMFEKTEAENAELKADNKLMWEVLEEHGVHDKDCVAGQFRQGRPTVHGGYETLYGYGKNEKWYQRDEQPECTCGLQDALTAIKGEPK